MTRVFGWAASLLLVLLVSIAWSASPVAAQERQPSPLQCDCILTQGNYETNTNVDNASLCIQQIDGQSCRVTVHCLVTGDGPGCDAKSRTEEIAREAPEFTEQGTPNVGRPLEHEFVELLINLLSSHFEFQGDVELPEEKVFVRARDLLEGASHDLMACVQQYAGRIAISRFDLNRESYDVFAEAIADEQIFCGVDVETGWLQIGFYASGRFFLIQFSPPS